MGWRWRQTWHDLAFLHWPVPADRLRPLVPQVLELERFEDTAWVAVTPLYMAGVTPRGLPPLPGLSRFPELNVRTYVRYQGAPGVWFFSLDAGNCVAVAAARVLFRLPYVWARMRVQRAGERVHYRSRRPDGTTFEAEYWPTGPAAPAPVGSLAYALVERYRLYVVRDAVVFQARIDHHPWPLRPAAAHITRNDLLRVHAIPASGPPPLVHFADRLRVRVWPLERASR